jgi:RNA polymerase sigma factor (sigma-70 family)
MLEHGPRLRALARCLVGDGHAADDLVQETWLRAVEHGSGASSTAWSWLARVLRNLAFQGRRLDARRLERERGTARREDEPEQRFSGHKDLVAAIDRLAEPYRQAILLRYFEDLPPRKIAAQLGVPVKTVKTRLNRGLALLREELDRSHGGRETWLAALAPMLKVGGSGGALLGAAREAFTASTVLKLAGAAVLVSAGVYLVQQERRGSPALVAPAANGPVLAAHSAESGLASPPELDRRGTREARGAAAPASAPATPAPVVENLVVGIRRGRVLGPDGNGLAGVLVGFAPRVQDAPEPVVSGTDGVFELPDLRGEVQSRDERFATVLISCLDPERAGPEDERVVVVAPAVTLGGSVRDGEGRPRATAHVNLEIPLSFRGRFREILDDSREGGVYVETDAEGRFLFTRAPGLGCARLVAWAGHESASVSVPEHDDLDLELVLSAADAPPPGPDALRIVGEVHHWTGASAPGALVSLAGVNTRTDAQGLFELFVPPASDHDPERARQLVAVARGEQAAILRPEHDASGAEVWPSFASLCLGQAPLSIAGRLLGTDGAPLAGAPVWIDDLTYLGSTHSDYLTLEHQLAGKPEHERWFVVHTDADGKFELDGLGERDYTLAAMDRATLQVVRTGPIPAGGEGVEIVLAREGLWERVAGRVVDAHGEPVAGRTVELRRVTFRVYSFEGGLCYGRDQRPGVQTDEDGRFELADVPRSGMFLCLPDQAFAPVDLELETVADPLDVRFEVARLGHVQIELAGAVPEGGSIELLDAHDQRLDCYVFGGSSLWTRSGVSLGNPDEFADGRTPVLSVPETARAAVLRDGEGNELRRVPLTVGEGLASVQL